MCKSLSVFLSFQGLFLRGAICKGKHFERQDSELNASFLCSKTLEDAYELASKHAVYPRTLIHEKVVKDLSGTTRTFVAKDLDYHFLHFSPQIVNSDGQNLNAVKKELEDIYETYKSCTSLHEPARTGEVQMASIVLPLVCLFDSWRGAETIRKV